MKPALTDLDRESARIFALVLLSQGFEVVVERQENRFELKIDDDRRDEALELLHLFYGENLRTGRSANEVKAVQKVWGPVWVVLLLGAVHWSADFYGVKSSVVHGFGSSALYILQGEIYRTVTALFLHADLGHLLGNAVGMIVFGVPVCTLVGTLPGLLMILSAGAAGNFVTALCYRTAHLSIGASTSVMGAAGILTAVQTAKRIRAGQGFHPKIFFPLGAGIALVGMLSGGENTDVLAHLTGFGAGLVLGALSAFFTWGKGLTRKG
ncbi:MAG: rhomboid family intramembrane serine protease [Desulfobacterium sp.]|jgi:membrane associated rhomboid family serine protease|nr:rhomboid family intramembrane serine protease [Desulfobacterium sp.]